MYLRDCHVPPPTRALAEDQAGASYHAGHPLPLQRSMALCTIAADRCGSCNRRLGRQRLEATCEDRPNASVESGKLDAVKDTFIYIDMDIDICILHIRTHTHTHTPTGTGTRTRTHTYVYQHINLNMNINI